MRSAHYLYSIDEHGGNHFRIQLPLGIKAEKDDFRPCVDGQFGDVIKTYRDWKICGDTKWLASLWPTVKKTIEYAWCPNNYDRWDPDKTGILWGRQHHTLDMELFGPNAWLSGYYIAALKAASEMAAALDDTEFAKLTENLFLKGNAWINKNLFNGEYYIQQLDINCRSPLEGYASHNLDYFGLPTDAVTQYWNEEAGQIKYQIGQGCMINMTIAQWYADLYGLGEIFDPAKVRQSLAALYKYNFKKSIRDVPNPWRNYALNDESALLICDWPDASQKPTVPLPYATEDMTGFSYTAAVQMVQSGLLNEGLTVIKAIRDRHDGRKRNPWNEFECGSNYARSMAAYSLLNAYSGFSFDMTQAMIGFNPVNVDETGIFSCFWSLDSVWGIVTFDRNAVKLEICYGQLKLAKLKLPFEPKQITLNEQSITYTLRNGLILFENSLELNPNMSLILLCTCGNEP